MSEYKLVTPPSESIISDTELLENMQNQAVGANSIFIPTRFGVLITPEAHYIFSVKSVERSNGVYDLPPLSTKIVSAETMHLVFCGAIQASLGNYKILVHGAAPMQLIRLTSRALDLMPQIEIPSIGQLNLYYNPHMGFPSNNEGPSSYLSLLKKMISERRLNFLWSQNSVGAGHRIRI